jgi:hypothetical protein
MRTASHAQFARGAAGIKPPVRRLGDLILEGYRAATRQPARTDFLSFLDRAGLDRHGGKLRLSPYNLFLARMMVQCFRSGKHLSHMGPPGLGKSTLGRLFSIWSLGVNPRRSVVFISGGKTVAQNNVGLCRKIILSHSFKRIFPEIEPDFARSRDRAGRGWSKDQFFLHNPDGHQADPSMEAVAAVPMEEARHPDILMADDIVTRAIAESPAMREEMFRVFMETWVEGRLAGGGWACAFQNCWHESDAAHRLRSDQRFCSLWVSVSDDYQRLIARIWNAPTALDDSLLDGEGIERLDPSAGSDRAAEAEYALELPAWRLDFTPAALAEKESNPETADIYRKLYRLAPATSADRMFPHWHARRGEEKTAAQMLGLGSVGELPAMNHTDRMRWVLAGGLDLSSGARPGDVLWILARNQEGIIAPVELHAGRFEIMEIIALIDSIWTRGLWFGALHVENNAVQDKIAREIAAVAQGRRYAWARNILEFTTGRNKSSPEMGLPVLDVEFQSGKIRWPEAEARRPGPTGDAWRRAAVAFSECPRFPARNETPDEVMAFWFARRALDRVGFQSGARKTETIRAQHQTGVEF